MTLRVHELLHLLVGLGLSSVLWRRQKHASVFVWVLVASLLLDADHVADYLRWVGPRWNLEALTTGSYFRESRKVMVLLHSWELAILLVVAGLRTAAPKYRSAFLGLGVGMLGHLALDQVWYHQPTGLYFLVVRLLHGFAAPEYW